MVATKGTYFVPEYHIPTPSHLLNAYFEKGGIPAGSLVQISSKVPGSFKTSMAVQMLAEAQMRGLSGCYIDAEGALDLYEDEEGRMRCDWFEGMGIDVSTLWFIGPGSGEEIYEEIYRLLLEEKVQFFIMDSIHAVQATKLYETEVGAHTIGQHATLHTKGVLKLLPLLRKTQSVMIGINHLKVNMTQQGAMGHNETGGKSWGFYSKFKWEMIRSNAKSSIEDKDLIPIEIYLNKSKGGKSFVSIKTFARQGYGIDQGSELAGLAIEKGIVTKAGSWYKRTDPTLDKKEATIGQGIDSLSVWALEHKKLILET